MHRKHHRVQPAACKRSWQSSCPSAHTRVKRLARRSSGAPKHASEPWPGGPTHCAPVLLVLHEWLEAQAAESLPQLVVCGQVAGPQVVQTLLRHNRKRLTHWTQGHGRREQGKGTGAGTKATRQANWAAGAKVRRLAATSVTSHGAMQSGTHMGGGMRAQQSSTAQPGQLFPELAPLVQACCRCLVQVGAVYSLA